MYILIIPTKKKAMCVDFTRDLVYQEFTQSALTIYRIISSASERIAKNANNAIKTDASIVPITKINERLPLRKYAYCVTGHSYARSPSLPTWECMHKVNLLISHISINELYHANGVMSLLYNV